LDESDEFDERHDKKLLKHESHHHEEHHHEADHGEFER